MVRRVGLGFLWGVLALLVIALSAYWWRYGRVEKALIKIPSKANALINIDLRKVEQSVFWDALYHPLAYWDDSSDDDDDDDDTPSMGVSYPKRVTFFIIEGADDVFFSQPVSVNSKDFQEYADTLVGRKEWELVDSQFVFDAEKKLFYFWDAHQLGVAYAKRTQADFVQTTLADLLSEKDCVPMSEDLSEKMNAGDHHFVIWRKQSEWTNDEPVFLYGDFEKGGVSIQGEVPLKYVFAENNTRFEGSQGDVLNISVNLNSDKNHFDFSDSFSQSFQKWTHLELDSFLLYSTGMFNLRVPKVSAKIDSIITYEYDDDFNKIEKVSTQEILVPEVLAQLSSKEDSLLFNYFERRGIVKDVDGASRFVGLPLVEMKAIAKGDQLLLTSGPPEGELTTTNEFLLVDLGCSQFPEMFNYLPFALDSAEVEMMDRVVLRGRPVPETKHVLLELKLQVKEKDRNVLGVFSTL